jgi:hypothetical protein
VKQTWSPYQERNFKEQAAFEKEFAALQKRDPQIDEKPGMKQAAPTRLSPPSLENQMSKHIAILGLLLDLDRIWFGEGVDNEGSSPALAHIYFRYPFRLHLRHVAQGGILGGE